jgi:betaine-aldehyde dehydrogenase
MIVWMNCWQPTFGQAPWGRMKASGIGRDLGRWGYEAFLEVKKVCRFDRHEDWGWYSNIPS